MDFKWSHEPALDPLVANEVSCAEQLGLVEVVPLILRLASKSSTNFTL